MSQPLHKAAEKIRDAVYNPGPHPAYHVAQLHRLRDEWPVLAQAINDLIKAFNQQENDQ